MADHMPRGEAAIPPVPSPAKSSLPTAPPPAPRSVHVHVHQETPVTAQSDQMPLTSAMWELAGLCWDWYQLPGNDVGGALHVVLDDMNIEDRNLAWCRTESIGVLWTDEGRVPAPPEYVAAATAILDGLAVLDDAQRAMVVHMADVYGPTRPKETTDV